MSLRRPRYDPHKPGPASLIDVQVSDGFKLVATGGNDVLENGNLELGVHVLDIGGICYYGSTCRNQSANVALVQRCGVTRSIWTLKTYSWKIGRSF
jgi:hypothetical protein